MPRLKAFGYMVGILVMGALFAYIAYAEALVPQTWWRWLGSDHKPAIAIVTGSHCYVGETPTISYEFRVDGKPYSGHGQAKPLADEGMLYSLAETVNIHYSPDRPWCNYTDYESGMQRYFLGPLTAVLLFPLMGIVFIVAFFLCLVQGMILGTMET
jgi:hypothetical protein